MCKKVKYENLDLIRGYSEYEMNKELKYEYLDLIWRHNMNKMNKEDENEYLELFREYFIDKRSIGVVYVYGNVFIRVGHKRVKYMVLYMLQRRILFVQSYRCLNLLRGKVVELGYMEGNEGLEGCKFKYRVWGELVVGCETLEYIGDELYYFQMRVDDCINKGMDPDYLIKIFNEWAEVKYEGGYK